MTTRRNFLRLSAFAVASPALLAACARDEFEPATSAGGLADSAWNDLASRMKGAVVLPGDDTYAALALPRNISYAHIRPQGVAMCVDASDVQQAVLWAQEHGIQPVPRSPAGHSYAGYSTTTGLSIDTTRMASTRLNADGTADIGAGSLLGNTASALAQDGVFIPIGRCPTVGISGLVLAGGFGFNSRLCGLTCDNLVETEIVTAEGELLRCNETENPDLFWACRGGNGGTFGVNTTFKVRVHPTREVGVFSLRWDDADSIVPGWQALQELAATAPNEFSMRIGIVNAPGRQPGAFKQSLLALGQLHGSADELDQLLEPTMATTPSTSTVRHLDFSSAEAFLSLLGSPNAFQAKSAFMDKGLSEEAIATLLDWMQEWPPEAASGSFNVFRWGGAINDVGADATSFVHRTPKFLIEGDVGWHPGASSQVAEAAKAWIQDGFNNRMRPYLTGHAFQNFIDRTQVDWQEAYYAGNFARLQDVKRRYDPKDVFRFAQSVPPAVMDRIQGS